MLARALSLLGYTNAYGEVDPQGDAELIKRGMAAVQQIYDDLYRIESGGRVNARSLSMDGPVPLDAGTVRDVMPYGVAMLIAQGESSGDSQALFASLYNRKRGSARAARGWRRDAMPRGGW